MLKGVVLKVVELKKQDLVGLAGTVHLPFYQCSYYLRALVVMSMIVLYYVHTGFDIIHGQLLNVI